MMRSEQEIRDSLAKMERMAAAAKALMADEKLKNIPALMDALKTKYERSSARASILKWVLGLPYLKEWDNDLYEQANKVR